MRSRLETVVDEHELPQETQIRRQVGPSLLLDCLGWRWAKTSRQLIGSSFCPENGAWNILIYERVERAMPYIASARQALDEHRLARMAGTKNMMIAFPSTMRLDK